MIVYVPATREAPEHAATPDDDMETAVQPAMGLADPPEGVAVKETLPVGTVDPVNCGVTVAVKVTGEAWLTVDGDPEVTSPRVVVAWFTVSEPASVPLLLL